MLNYPSNDRGAEAHQGNFMVHTIFMLTAHFGLVTISTLYRMEALNWSKNDGVVVRVSARVLLDHFNCLLVRASQ